MFWLIAGGAALIGGAFFLAREARAHSTRTLVAAVPIAPATAVVGRVEATAQETPWTCGPAALRAALAHYGRAVSEAELGDAAVVAPAIGARPEGMVKAAELYGCHARAFVMDGIADLVGLLAQGVPPIVIVDSWTRPGQVGHYVVVSRIDLTRGLVTVMDPHTEGNWRVLTVKDFDARWWAKRQGPDGRPIIIKRVCVVVEPGDEMAATVTVGADKPAAVASPVAPPTAPAHGRTAKCNPPGGFWHWWGAIASKGGKAVFKGGANYMSGGTYSKSGLGGLVDKVTTLTSTYDAGKMRDFVNTADNDAMAAWGIGWLRDRIKDRLAKFDGKAKGHFDPKITLINTWTRAQLEDAVKVLGLDDVQAALALTFRVYFVTFKGCQSLHVLQACAILLYGGVEVVPVFDELLKAGRPKVNGKPVPLEAWREGIVQRLEAFQASKEAAAVQVTTPATE